MSLDLANETTQNAIIGGLAVVILLGAMLIPHSASWGEVEIIRKLGHRGDSSDDKQD